MAKRDEARQRAITAAKVAERRAGKKVSRNAAQGIDIAGTRFDPRVGARKVDAMSTNEARAHVRALTEFLSRKTQFAPTYGNAPVRREDLARYQAAEAVNNERAASFINRFGAVKLPGQDTTISGRIKATTPEQRANNQGRVHESITRDPQSIVGQRALDKLSPSMEKKARADYVERTVRARFNSGEGALRNAGFDHFEEEIEALTLTQKQLLIDASTFFDIAVENMVGSPPKSEVKEYRDADYKERNGSDKSEEVENALREQLEWVKEIAPRNPRDAKGRFISLDQYIDELVESYEPKPKSAAIKSAGTTAKKSTRGVSRRRKKN